MSVVFLWLTLHFALDLPRFLSIYVISSCRSERRHAAWVDDEPVSLVSYSLAHPLRGCGKVGNQRTGTVDRVARPPNKENLTIYATHTTKCCGYLEGALFFVCLVLPLVFGTPFEGCAVYPVAVCLAGPF